MLGCSMRDYFIDGIVTVPESDQIFRILRKTLDGVKPSSSLLKAVTY